LAGGHPIRFAGSIDANPLTACQNSRADSETTTDSLLAVFERDVLLATGRAIRIRPARPTDIERLRTFYDALAPASRHLRFFGGRPFIPHDELERTTVNDVYRHVALFAEFGDQIVGVGEYFASTAGEEAEVAFAVADAHHHEGIATVLLEDLAMVAKAAGFHRLVALTLPENAAMQEVFRTVGLAYRSWLDDGAVRVQLDLTADDLLHDDADHRDWQAVVRSLRSLVKPEHVVMIGAGRDETSAGRRILGHLLESFKGQVSVVHPTAVAVGGVDTVGRLDQLDTVPDLAIIAVPAESVVAVVEQCGAFGVPTAVIISAGFAEVGAGGWRLQDDVLAAARRHGMRIVGPNCLGVVATSCGLNATFTSRVFRPGGIAIASQSGGVGIAIAAEAERRAAGISSFVSMGNKADVSGNDLLRLWAGDESTNVVLLYLESFGDPVRFARVARAVSRRKPIVALKSGRSAPGRRGAQSHTAALASDQATVDALFAHTGVLRAHTLEELMDVGLLLDRQRVPAGRRVALIGNVGGPLILGADAADAGGLDVPVLSASLQQEIASLAPAAAATANPVDLSAAVTAEQLAEVVKSVAASGEVDACLIVCVEIDVHHRLDDIDSLLADDEPAGVPLALTLIGTADFGSAKLPIFPTPERAAAAMAIAAQRAEWLATVVEEDDEPAEPEASSWVAVRRLARRHIDVHGDTAWLDQASSFELLEAAGVSVAPWAFAASAEDCADAADRLGPLVVIKAEVIGALHKSDVDAVRLGIGDAATAAEQYRQFEQRFGRSLRGVLVQSQQSAALELLIGALRDPTFGPLIVVGAGGVEAELRDDRVVLVAPVSRTAARLAVESLRLAPLLHGFRGRPELPVDAVVEFVHRLGLLAATVPEIQQLDLNPLLVNTTGCVAVDALVGVASPTFAAVPARGLRGPSGCMPVATSRSTVRAV
jgi:acyl-CoA synthetase (NDP forming)/GNAT superfamily N-acetyltransferase